MKAESRFTVQELAQTVGVSTSALRAWERRYGLFDPERTPGGHRLYTFDDLRLYWYVEHLRSEGRELRVIAGRGRQELLLSAREYFARREVSTPDHPSEILAALARADFSGAIRLLEQMHAVSPHPRKFADQALEVMRAVGDAWHRGEVSVAGEHCITSRVKHLLLDILYGGGLAESEDAPVAVCGTVPDEQHELGILRAAIALKSWGWRVTYLGADTPLRDLHEHVRHSRPRLVALSASEAFASCAARRRELSAILESLSLLVAPLCVTVIGGKGMQGFGSCPAAIVAIDDLAQLESVATRCRENALVPPLELAKALRGCPGLRHSDQEVSRQSEHF